MRRVTFVVTPDQAGLRLDKLLTLELSGIGRKKARELFATGAVQSDGRRVRGSDLSVPGARIEIAYTPEAAEPDPAAELRVVLERPELVVLEKPAGQPSVPLAAGELGTVANALLARYPEMAGIGYRPREPGLIHRLDTQTSGLLLAARSARAFGILKSALSRGALSKRYLAVTEDAGLPQNGDIRAALGPDPRHSDRMQVFAEAIDGAYVRPAKTLYSVVERHHGRLLIELEVAHATRHQIRVHLASVGHPILGDEMYGAGRMPELGARHALHASYIAWAGDATLSGFEARAPLPPELRALLD